MSGVTIRAVWPGVYRASGFSRAFNAILKDDPRGRYKFDGDRELAVCKAWYFPQERLHDILSAADAMDVPVTVASRHGPPTAKLPMPAGLMPWQERGLRRLLEQRALLAQWCTGAGKSRLALEAHNALPEGSKTLVICPKVVMRTWEDEQIPRWAPKADAWALLQGRKLDRPQPGIVICSYGSMHRIPDEWKFDLLVYDELHYGIHGQSRRSKEAERLSAKNWKALRLGLTATPTSASLTDIHSQLNILCPTRWGSYSRWWRYFFIEEEVGYEDYTKPGSPKGVTLPLLTQELETICDYVSHEDVGDALPPVSWHRMALEPRGRIQRRGTPETVRQWRAEQQALAADRAEAFAYEWEHDKGTPRAIVCYHRSLAQDLHSRIPGSVIVTGEVPPKERHRRLASAYTAIVTMRSVTEGLDLRRYTEVFVLEAYPVPLYLTQVLGRFVRLFATDPVTVTFCDLKGSSDDVIVHRLLQRLEEQSLLARQGKVERGMARLLTMDENSDEFLASLRDAVDSGIEEEDDDLGLGGNDDEW